MFGDEGQVRQSILIYLVCGHISEFLVPWEQTFCHKQALLGQSKCVIKAMSQLQSHKWTFDSSCQRPPPSQIYDVVPGVSWVHELGML